MSTIQGMRQEMFALAANDITILAQDTVRVQVSIAIVSLDTVFENAGYYIPVNGVVHLGELGELANSCIQLAENFGRFGMEQSRNAYCTLTISLPDEEISSSSELWYCRKDLGGVLPPIPRFATALRNRRLSADQFFPLFAPCLLGLTVYHKLAFLDNGEIKYITDEEEVIGFGHDNYKPIDISPYTERAVSPVSSSAKLLFYDVELYHHGDIVDRVHCEVEEVNYHHTIEIVYINFLGVQDCIMLRGDDEETHEMEASYDYFQSTYQRYDTQFTEEHKASSGWIDNDEWKAICDMVESPYLSVVANGGFIPIVITDVDVKRVQPSNAPKAITITWRYANRYDMRRMKATDFMPTVSEQGVFEKPSFDETFE